MMVAVKQVEFEDLLKEFRAERIGMVIRTLVLTPKSEAATLGQRRGGLTLGLLYYRQTEPAG